MTTPSDRTADGLGPGTHGPRPPRAGRRTRAFLAIAVALAVLLAGYGVYAYLAAPPADQTLTIYTYDSLLGGGCGANASAALAPFATAHQLRLLFECPEGNLESTLVAEKDAPSADLVIGLDEITASQAAAQGVLVPYSPPELADVPPALVAEISPDHAVTPYEWGYLGIDECDWFNASTAGAAARLNFPEIASNGSWASNLLIEDPSTDITGEEFLAWEIEFYTQVLHESWQPFWSAVAPRMTTADNWGDAYSLFTSDNCSRGTPGLWASYLNDPASDAFYAGPPVNYNSSVSWWNGTGYGWKTIYGIGIVAGTHHLADDEALIDYFLTGSIQRLLPTTEWEFPANETVGVPAIYRYAMNSSGVRALNDGVAPSVVAADMPAWIDDWQTVVNAAG